MGVVETAQQLADEVLYPAALTTDESETLPAELLDTLSAAGLYGIVGPEWAGGCEAEFLDFCAAIEALASGCLTTTFVWVQHHGAVRAAMLSENEAVRDWLTTLCRGGWRAGLALGGALPGEPRLVAREVDDGWKLDGVSPFVSGWAGSTSSSRWRAPRTDGSSACCSTPARAGRSSSSGCGSWR